VRINIYYDDIKNFTAGTSRSNASSDVHVNVLKITYQTVRMCDVYQLLVIASGITDEKCKKAHCTA